MRAEQILSNAYDIAERVHAEQKYGTKPYFEGHILKVVGNVYRLANTKLGDLAILVAAAYLHDTLEDTTEDKAALEKEILEKCGEEVLKVVKFLTNDTTGQTKFDRKSTTYSNISTDYRAVIVKLCDRLANLEEGGKVDMYRKEHDLFKGTLYSAENAKLWKEIDKIIYN